MVNLAARLAVSPQFARGKPFPITTGRLAVSELPLHEIFRIQADVKDSYFQAAVESTLGLKIPAPERASENGSTQLAWAGPCEWLCLCPSDAEDSTEDALKEVFAGHFATVTQVSDSRVCFEVSGADATLFLSKGCAIDLDRTIFRPGHVVTTRFAGLPAILIKNADDLFKLYLDVAYTAFMVDWLLDAAEEFRS